MSGQPWQDFTVMPTALIQADLSTLGLRLMLALAKHANGNRQAWPGHARLLKYLPKGTTERALRRAKAECREKGWLECEVGAGVPGRGGRTCLYTLMIPAEQGGDETVAPDETANPGRNGTPDETVLPTKMVLRTIHSLSTPITSSSRSKAKALATTPITDLVSIKEEGAEALLEKYKQDPVYQGIDAMVEYSRAIEWYQRQGRPFRLSDFKRWMGREAEKLRESVPSKPQFTRFSTTTLKTASGIQEWLRRRRAAAMTVEAEPLEVELQEA